MKSEGFYLSIEAIASMLMLVILLSMPLPESRNYMQDLHDFKKGNDLLILWARQGTSLNLEQMRKDFEFAFPGKSALISLDSEKAVVGKQGREAIASKAFFFGSALEKHEISLAIFKEYSA
ncbi:MAG: hypothetical protein JW744_03070 [Candidatus Diapherotrites archaeon]|uniref:Uncharacterized protein n=1 Tax=Candidatus Iainarchaeum sp. TaxID=3101447 RepID=A0A938YST0_9ARCH|nr:hypothetical protein [Candidatus Diapherotrites archaeon]